MRKMLLLLVLLFIGAQVFAQTTITGTVTDAEGVSIPGANVMVKGIAGKGAITNFEGKYSLNVPANASALVFSSVGLGAQEVEIAGKTVIDVSLKVEDEAIDEVVVTALGISKKSKALGYAVETVDDSQLQKSAQTSVIDALGGKVAGVRINRASGEAGASSFIEIRGSSSLTRNNQPLFVVDGVPIDNSGNSKNTIDGVSESNRAIDINPDDVEKISILKGGAATALYGIRAANGAVIITTKSGKNTEGRVEINYSGSMSFALVSQLPKLQRSYAQGYYGMVLSPDYAGYSGVSWGPKLSDLRYTKDPSYIPSGSSIPMNEWIANWDPNGRIVLKDSPFAGSQVPNSYDHYDFFQTGITNKHHVDVSGGDKNGTFYMSLGNTSSEGVIPNNKFNKTSFKLASTRNLGRKVTVGGTVNYIHSEGERIQKGSNLSGIMLGLLRCPPSFDNSFKYQLKDKSQRSYRGGGGYDNPFWTVNKILYNDKVNRILGNINLKFQATEWLNFSYRLGADFWFKDVKDYFEKGSNANPEGKVSDSNSQNSDLNSDFIMTIQKEILQDLNFTLTLGQNLFQTRYTYTQAVGNGLIDYDFYNMNNSADVRGFEGSTKKRTAAFYGDIAFDYKGILFLNATGRQEWSTTMPEDNNSFFYPSVSMGFVFSELGQMKSSSFLSFGKLRASYASIANDAALYATKNYFYKASAGDGWTDGITYPFLGVSAFTVGSTIGNKDLKPETMNSLEVGLDLRFFKNRLGIDVAYFKNENNDLLLSQPIAPSSGFAYKYVNAGSMQTTGFEVVLSATPVKTKSFEWNILATWSNPYSEVTKLAENVPNIFLSGFTEPQVRAVEGTAYRTLYGVKWARDNNGNILINDNPNDASMDGFPFSDPDMQAMGSVSPEWTAGITNSLRYRGFSLSFLIDIKHGGVMWNGTKGAMYFFGTHADTEIRDKEKVWEGVYGHIDVDGNIMHMENGVAKPGPGVKNTKAVVMEESWFWNGGEGSGFTGPSEPFVEEAGWVRLREVSFSYSLPKVIFDNTFVSAFEIYFTGTNLWLNTPYTGVDPETSLVGNNNGLGLDYFNNPGTKSFTFGVRIGL